MKRKTSKILSVLLALVMMFSLVPAASAAGTDTTVPVTSISIEERNVEIAVGASKTLTPTVLPANATDKTITWSSDDVSVVTVDSTGRLTGHKEGKAIITASNSTGTVEDHCQVSVKKIDIPATSIELNKSADVVRVGKTTKLTATVKPENTTDAITWNSSNPTVATVADGVVTGLKVGSTVITAKAGTRESEGCTITVMEAVVTPTVTLSTGASTSMYTGGTFTLTAKLSPDTLTADWNCTVSDSSILTVTPSSTTKGTWTVTANTKTGESTITITDKNTGVKNTCKVTVQANSIGSAVLSFNDSSVSVDPGAWKSVSVYTNRTSSYSTDYVVWTLPSNNGVAYIDDTTSSSSSYWGTSKTTYFGNNYNNYTTTGIYVRGYAAGTTTLTATLYNRDRQKIDSIPIPVYVGRTASGYALSPSPSNTSAVYLYYDDYYRDDYWWNTSYRYSRDFSVTPTYNGSSILNSSSYDITYTWTLNSYTQVNSSSTSRSYTLYANNSYLNRSTRGNTLTCTARIYNKGTNTLVSSPSVSWTVYNDYYYNDGSFTVSATVYDTTSHYNLNDKDDKNSSSIISQISDKLYDYYYSSSYGRDYISYVRFSNVTSSYGSLNASTSRDYYYDSSRTSSYDLRDVDFTPSKTGTASFDCTVYGTRGNTYKCTINIKVEAGTTDKTASTIYYNTTGTKSVTLSASDFTSRYKDVVGSSASTLTIKFRNVPSNGTLKYNSTTLTSSNIGNYEFSSSSSASYRISDVTYTPKNNSNSTDTIDYYCYTGSTRRFSGSIKFTNTKEDTTPTVPSGITVSYSTTGASVNFGVSDFTGKHSALVSASYIVFGSPSSGTLNAGGSTVSSGTKFAYVANTSKGYQFLGGVSYKPAAGFSGTATIPFTAYNADDSQAATGSVNISVSQTTTTTPTNTAKTFKDVSSTAWYYNDVMALSAAGIVDGGSDGNFDPQGNVTYGAALKLVLLAAGYPKQVEPSGNWAQNYLTLALSNSILPGSAGDYSLNAAIDRTAMATMAAKALKLTPVTSGTSPYSDTNDGYVRALTDTGIVQGDNGADGVRRWRGTDTLTRAEMSRIVYNIYKYRNVSPGGTSTTTPTTTAPDTNKPDWLR